MLKDLLRLLQVFSNSDRREGSLVSIDFGRCIWVRPYSRFKPFSVLRLNFFLTIEQRLNRSFAFLSLVRMKRPLNSPEDNVERYAGLLPGFHQCPIDRAQKEMLPSPSNKRVFNFGEVVEVIH